MITAITYPQYPSISFNTEEEESSTTFSDTEVESQPAQDSLAYSRDANASTKPFKCTVEGCTATFKSKSNLTIHTMKVHTEKALMTPKNFPLDMLVVPLTQKN